MQTRGKKLAHRARHLGPILTVAGVGLLASWSAWHFASAADEARVRGVLELRAEWRTRDLERKLRGFVTSAHAMGALVAAQTGVDRGLLHRFASEAHSELDPVRRLGWAPRVVRNPQGELQIFGGGDPAPVPLEQDAAGALRPMGPKPEHFPIVVDNVYKPGAAFGLLGLDLMARADTRASLQAAIDEAKLTSSPPVRFIAPGRSGIFVYAPVYQGARIPDTVEDRRSQIRGLAFATFLVRETLQAAIEGTPEIVETIRFVVPASASDPVAEYRPGTGIVLPQPGGPRPADGIGLVKSIDLVGQKWTLEFAFPPDVENGLRSPAPFLWLLAGLAATGILVLFLLYERNRTLRVEALVRARTADLGQAKSRMDTAIAHMSHGLAMFDRDRKLVVSNKRYSELYDLPHELVQPGTTYRDILEHRARTGGYAGRDLKDFIRDRMATVAAGEPADVVLHLNKGRVLSLFHRPMPDGGWVSTHEDITERRQIEARMEHMARHDALTDLPNRVLFRERLEQALTGFRAEGNVAVLGLDLDRFKAVNDTLGHPAGDALLRKVAERLKACVGPGDCIARLGGDEFAIVQVGVERPEQAGALAESVLAALGASYDLDGRSLFLGASIGIALAPGDGVQPDELFRNADVALYRAKAEGRNMYRFFEAGMDAQLQARRAIELDLRKGLQNGQFELFYQPLVNLEREEVSGFEALVRWRHPERGMISPADFIPAAEDTGLILPLGEWVLREACREAARWPAHIKVAVNLSPVQFRLRHLPDVVVSALAASGLHPSRLELEITESVVLQECETVRTILHQLRTLGVHISLDDFGTGYCSLSYLRSFPFDKIKIDRSFIGGLSEQAESIAIVRAVTGLGRSLGMMTTAEGIETKDQLERLRNEGCTEGQGFLFSPPMPASELGPWLGNAAGRVRSAA